MKAKKFNTLSTVRPSLSCINFPFRGRGTILSESMTQMNSQSSSNSQNQTHKSELGLALISVTEELEELNRELPEYFESGPKTAKDILKHVFTSGGKRIRPAIFMMACDLCNYHGQQRMHMGAVCELVHTASLLHDDVIDNSSLRRNKPTSNAIWGDQAAVLAGDLVYARASQMMADTGDQRIVSTFASAIQEMSKAELMQLEHVSDPFLSKETHFEIIQGKTAALIAASCKPQAMVKNATQP